MADVATTTGYPVVLSMGDKMLYLYRVTSVDDAETLTTGLGTRIISVQVGWTGNPATQTSGGGHYSVNTTTGVITFYPSTSALGADVWVIADGS